MKSYQTIFPILALTFFLSQVEAAGLLDQFIEAQAVFESSLAGNEADTEPAIAEFTKLVGVDQEQPLYLAYLGSAYTLKARDAWMPWSRLINAEKGLDMIDKALSMLKPGHDDQRIRGSIISTETRLVAINTFLLVPKFLNRGQAAKELLVEAFDSPVFGVSAPEVKGRLFMQAAEIARREEQWDQATMYLKRARPLVPPGRYQQLVTQQLREIARQ